MNNHIVVLFILYKLDCFSEMNLLLFQLFLCIIDNHVSFKMV